MKTPSDVEGNYIRGSFCSSQKSKIPSTENHASEVVNPVPHRRGLRPVYWGASHYTKRKYKYGRREDSVNLFTDPSQSERNKEHQNTVPATIMRTQPQRNCLLNRKKGQGHRAVAAPQWGVRRRRKQQAMLGEIPCRLQGQRLPPGLRAGRRRPSLPPPRKSSLELVSTGAYIFPFPAVRAVSRIHSDSRKTREPRLSLRESCQRLR